MAHFARRLQVLFLALIFLCAPSSRAEEGFYIEPIPPVSEGYLASRTIPFRIYAPVNRDSMFLHCTIRAGTATSGRDFKSAGFVIYIYNGFADSEFTIHADDEMEEDETIEIHLAYSDGTRPPNYPPILTPVTVVTIRDLRGYGLIAPPPKAAAIWESAPSLPFTAYRVSNIASSATVTVRAVPSSTLPAARANIDFVEKPITLAFAPGQTQATGAIALINNSLRDGNRSLDLRLENPSDNQPLISDATQTWLIKDNELGYSFRNLDSRFEGDSYEGPSPYLIFFRHGDFDFASTAQINFNPEWALRSPVATPAVDFEIMPITVEFLPGQNSARVQLPILNDNESEPTEFIPAVYPAFPGRDEITSDSIPIFDNEFNPLPVTNWNLPFLSRFQEIVAAADGKYLAAFQIDSFENDQVARVLRLNADRTIDSSFQGIEIAGEAPYIIPAPDGGFYLLTRYPTGDSQSWLQRLNPDGSPDPTFATFRSSRWIFVYPARNRQVLVANSGALPEERLLRVRSDGSIDPAFRPLIDGEVRSAYPFDDGRIFVTGTFATVNGASRLGAAQLSEDGVLDSTFNPSQRRDYVASQNEIFSFDPPHIEYLLRRVLPSGEPDLSFNPISWSWAHQDILRDRLGRFYRIADTPRLYFPNNFPRPLRVDRFLPDGRIDLDYVTGTVDAFDGQSFRIHESEMLFRLFGPAEYAKPFVELNGTPLAQDSQFLSDSYFKAFARLDLDPPSIRLALLPGEHAIAEHRGAQHISIIRTGPNHDSQLSVNYAVRAGSATPGVHFNMPVTGQLLFDRGVSKLPLEIVAIDNDRLEPNTEFLLDLTSDDLPNTTLTIRILGDETGLRIQPSPTPGRALLQFISNNSAGARLNVSGDGQTWTPELLRIIQPHVLPPNKLIETPTTNSLRLIKAFGL